MKLLRNIHTIAIATMCGLGLASCNDWLDVKMEDKVMENTLFSDFKGYRAALNGVYVSLNDIYTTHLGPGALDVMAQYYNVTEDNSHTMRMYSRFKYADSDFQSATNNIWTQMYTMLANLNLFIEHTDESSILTEAQNGLMRGEALALRAFLHFDLLRLYGPIYSNNSTEICIPYQASSKREIEPMLPANEVIELILKDINEAETLLAEYDPIITEGVQNTATSDDGVTVYDMSFRQLRFNYYATLALKARVNLWKGDKSQAYNICKNQILDKITSEDLEVFPWATKAQVEADKKPDYLFSSEVFFSLYNSKRNDNLQKTLFAENLTMASRLTFIGSSLDGNSKVALFYDDPNDLRKLPWKIVEPSNAERQAAAEKNEEAPNTLAFGKYEPVASDADLNGTETYRYMIPLIRLSEIYLIMAECTTDMSEAFDLINTVRSHRECMDVDPNGDFDRALTYEFAREMIGEGQLFYFYKRRAMTELISGTSLEKDYPMTLENYIFPIPDAELEKRVLVNGK